MRANWSLRLSAPQCVCRHECFLSISNGRLSVAHVTTAFSKFLLDIRQICRIGPQIRSLYLSPLNPGRCIVDTVNAIGVSFLPVALRWLFPLKVLPSNFEGLRLCREPFLFSPYIAATKIFMDRPISAIFFALWCDKVYNFYRLLDCPAAIS